MGSGSEPRRVERLREVLRGLLETGAAKASMSRVRAAFNTRCPADLKLKDSGETRGLLKGCGLALLPARNGGASLLLDHGVRAWTDGGPEGGGGRPAPAPAILHAPVRVDQARIYQRMGDCYDKMFDMAGWSRGQVLEDIAYAVGLVRDGDREGVSRLLAGAMVLAGAE